jgi:alkaline phosphatase
MAAGVVGVGSVACSSDSRRSGAARQARNIIFFACDGMSWEDVALAQHHARRETGGPLVLDRLLRRSSSGSQETYSLTSVVTDSAAAASAWSTGRKIVNYMMNRFPDGTDLTTIFDIARARGMATGLVTTTRITHATPAAFVAKTDNRSLEDAIALQYEAFAPDVLLGGGARHFSASRRSDGHDVAGDFAARGYSVVRDARQLATANGSRLLGLFASGHVPFEIDRRPGDAHPPLSAMAAAALRVLAETERGFVLQVEAGRIDHANHKNDAAATLHELLEMERALAVVLAFAEANPETLLILASDHATGGIGVYGAGRHYLESSARLRRLDAHTASFDRMLELLGAGPTAGDVIDIVRAGTGVALSPVQAAFVVEAIVNAVAAGNPIAFRDQPHNTLGWVLAGGAAVEGETDRPNVNFATGQHTAAAVPFAAFGAGADALPAGLVDNTELFGWMTAALGEEVVNPSMREADALELIGAAAAADAAVHH